MIISYRTADILDAVRNMRTPLMVQLAIFDHMGNGDDSIDVAIVDSQNNPVKNEPKTRVVYEAVLALVQEYSRSFDANIINTPIDVNNNRYKMPKPKPNDMFERTGYDFAVKLKAAIPYYFSGITEDAETNEAGSRFLFIEVYETKYAIGDTVRFEHYGDTYSGMVRGINGEGQYSLHVENVVHPTAIAPESKLL